MHFFASFIPNILCKLCPKHPFFATNILCWSCSSTTCLFCNCRWQDGNNNYWIRFHMHLKTKLQSILCLLQCCCNYQIFNDKQEGNMDQKCKLGHTQILRDYFTKHLIYDDDLFQHQYQMHRPLFLQITKNICAHDPYFVQKRYACDVLGLSSIKKCTNVLCMLALVKLLMHAMNIAGLKKAHHMNVSSVFLRAIREVFKLEFLKQPTWIDLEKQMKMNANKRWLGMFVSLDCMHYHWNICLVV